MMKSGVRAAFQPCLAPGFYSFVARSRATIIEGCGHHQYPPEAAEKWLTQVQRGDVLHAVASMPTGLGRPESVAGGRARPCELLTHIVDRLSSVFFFGSDT
ncbi:hypothetical protein F441_21067 [Phytophthora nicotianae CJ01A1]|uniref:Uncharacterized protein n=4 Tax=Phytophthora nicotianae TaxID=4792 RepID=V9DYF5_PHYNI|nr:hypothetical protein F443_21186 [Phytophthora nicotianae P1569]ETK72267.1 hypothetical protein L915_20604 [Phytophthora nicotianae]ETL25722.1 hypothetical protein L916_20464 [Phytophthora nicotianae]ETL78930.1 hypothetical protein L917_20337 [Phytophthora nicotianae]ETP01733.1 hypothetical protein F441_21067 [Phytophthora nicotianae CJ01A1]